MKEGKEEDGLPSFIEFDEDNAQDLENFDFSGKSIPSSKKPKANKKLGKYFEIVILPWNWRFIQSTKPHY